MNQLRAVKHLYKHINFSQNGRYKRLADRPEEVIRPKVSSRSVRRRRNALRGCVGVTRE
jgi:hypothetical protein